MLSSILIYIYLYHLSIKIEQRVVYILRHMINYLSILLPISYIFYRVSQKDKKIFRNYWMVFSKNCIWILKLVAYPRPLIWLSSLKNVEFMNKIVRFFLHVPDFYKLFCKYWRTCNFFAIWLRMLILTNFKIQKQFWNISSSLFKNLYSGLFGTCCIPFYLIRLCK